MCTLNSHKLIPCTIDACIIIFLTIINEQMLFGNFNYLREEVVALRLPIVNRLEIFVYEIYRTILFLILPI